MSRTDDTYLKQLQARYREASKTEKSGILDEFVKTTVSWPNILIRSLFGQSPEGVTDSEWLIRRTDVLFGQDRGRRPDP